VIIGNAGDKYSIILERKPDIIALGYDQSTFTDNIESKLNSRGLDVRVVRIESHKPHKYKSSLIRKVSSEDQ